MKIYQSINFKKFLRTVVLRIKKAIFAINILLILNLCKTFQSINKKKIVNPAAVLYIKKILALKIPAIFNLWKTLQFINFKRFIKPAVLILSLIIIVSMVSLLATTAVKGETDSNKALKFYSVATNSSTSIPTFNTTLPKPTPAFTHTFIPAIALNSALIPDQAPDPTVMPTPTSSASLTIIPDITVNPTPTPNPSTTPTQNPTHTLIPTARPNPDPTITPLSALSNLEAFPDDWGEYSMGYGIIFSSVIPPSQPQIAAIDYSVLYNGEPSIRLERYVSGSENIAREVNGNWIKVNPGDHIVFSCWMKTTSSALGYNGAAGSGARIGYTYYDSKFIADIQYTGPYTWNPTYQQICDNYVPWNTAAWTLRTLDFIVPSTVYDYNGAARTPTGIIPWMQATPITDGGNAYFAETTLYLNP